MSVSNAGEIKASLSLLRKRYQHNVVQIYPSLVTTLQTGQQLPTNTYEAIMKLALDQLDWPSQRC